MRRRNKSLVAGVMMHTLPILVAAAGFGVYKADPEFRYERSLLGKVGVDTSALDKPMKVQSLNGTYTGLANLIHK